MLRARERGEEVSKRRLKAAPRIVRWQVRHWRLLTDDELEFGDEADDQLTVWPQRFQQCVPPPAHVGFALDQYLTYQRLERLGQRRIWDVTLVEVELARGE